MQRPTERIIIIIIKNCSTCNRLPCFVRDSVTTASLWHEWLLVRVDGSVGTLLNEASSHYWIVTKQIMVWLVMCCAAACWCFAVLWTADSEGFGFVKVKSVVCLFGGKLFCQVRGRLISTLAAWSWLCVCLPTFITMNSTWAVWVCE